MKKVVSLSDKKKETYETCVLCKKQLDIKKDENIEERYGYIEGVGQLCYDCYQKYK